MSDDKRGHKVTRYGCLWTPQGDYFDGVDDYARIENSDAFNVIPDSGLTLIAWAYARNYEGAACHLIARYTPWTCGYVLRVETSKIQINIVGAGGGTFGATTLDTGRWYHFAGTSDNNTARVFLNGEIDGESSKAALSSGGSYLIFGYQASSHGWKGSYGAAYMYHRCFTPLEVRKHYEATKWRYQ
jgi:hypothetical protein